MFLARIYNFFSSMRLVFHDKMICKNIEKQNSKVPSASQGRTTLINLLQYYYCEWCYYFVGIWVFLWINLGNLFHLFWKVKILPLLHILLLETAVAFYHLLGLIYSYYINFIFFKKKMCHLEFTKTSFQLLTKFLIVNRIKDIKIYEPICK